MSTYISPRIILLSVVYFIVAILIIFLVDIGLGYFLNDLVFRLLDWFNSLSIFWKLLLIFLGGVSLFMGFLQLTAAISRLLGGLIFNKLPNNTFTIISSSIIAIANAVYNIILLWRVPVHYNFWIVVELLLLSVFIWSLCSVVWPLKEQ